MNFMIKIHLTVAYLSGAKNEAKKIGPITIGSRVRDTTSCVFLPQTVEANSVHL